MTTLSADQNAVIGEEVITLSELSTAEQREKVADGTIKSLTAESVKLHSELNATRGLVEDMQKRIAYYQNLQLEWHDAHDQMARQQLRLEQQLQKLRADSCHADMAYHARVSELEGQLEKFLRADEDDSPVEEDDENLDQDSLGAVDPETERISNKLRMQAKDPLALGMIGLHR
tara:strand:- start:229 stop:750 length:522 start_codon:yes stop_codon:yes gene_type:complete